MLKLLHLLYSCIQVKIENFFENSDSLLFEHTMTISHSHFQKRKVVWSVLMLLMQLSSHIHPTARHPTIFFIPSLQITSPRVCNNTPSRQRTESHVSWSDRRWSFLYISFRFSAFPITKVFPSDYNMRLAASITSVTWNSSPSHCRRTIYQWTRARGCCLK